MRLSFKTIHKSFISLVISLLLVTGLFPVAGITTSKAMAVKAKTDPSTVVVKFKPNANLELMGDSFTGSTAPELNKRLKAHGAGKMKQLISDDRQSLKRNERAVAATAEASGRTSDLSQYYTIQLSGNNADVVAEELKKLPVVATAYAKPLPTPAPATPNFVSLQKYLNAAPTGMDVRATVGGSTTPYPGGNGDAVMVADLEYSWNVNHEDLSKLRVSGAYWANGTPADPFNNNNHGTAVAGVIAADKNAFGVDGITYGTSFNMVNTYSSDRGWDIANAIYMAANKMSKGDVILIEQQAWAPDGDGYAPIEIYQDVYDAIVYATSKGVTVIEPAGNGRNSSLTGYDLNDPIFNGIFTTARPNSGAIMVGAGAGGCGFTPAHARMAFSNYGTRVDVQGFGECVITTGSGSLYNGGTNALYYDGFNGTSSASATIAGVAAELSSVYERANSTSLGSAELKARLKANGTAQNTSTNIGNIGLLPNMAQTLKLTDTTAPTAPTSLTATVKSRRVTLNWKAATDNMGYVRYEVFRNNVKVATTTSLTYLDTSTTVGTYEYQVRAVDGNNYVSLFSNKVTARVK